MKNLFIDDRSSPWLLPESTDLDALRAELADAANANKSIDIPVESGGTPGNVITVYPARATWYGVTESRSRFWVASSS